MLYYRKNKGDIYESGTLWDMESIDSEVPWEKHRNEIKLIKIEDENTLLFLQRYYG